MSKIAQSFIAVALVALVVAQGAVAEPLLPPPSQDYRSPDARIAVPVSDSTPIDLRSPDARSSLRVMPQVPAPAGHGSSPADWPYFAGIGAALALLALGVVTLTRRRRRQTVPLGV